MSDSPIIDPAVFSLEARNASLPELVALLQVQHEAKLDLLVPAANIDASDGLLHMPTDPEFPGVKTAFRPTPICDGHLATKLDIPLAYLRRMRATRPDLLDANVNGWLHGPTDPGTDFHSTPDPRTFLVRCFKPVDMFGDGVARAMVSDKFNVNLDNYDSVLALLAGIRESGIRAEVLEANISETKMTLSVGSPDIAAWAPELLAGYRNPIRPGERRGARPAIGGWTIPAGLEAAAREGHGYTPGEEPIVFAGFRFENSETGSGGWSMRCELLIKVCANGLTLPIEMIRRIHIGAKLEGADWSQKTKAANLELVKSMTQDAVGRFLDPDFMQARIAELTEKAIKPLEHPVESVTVIAKELAFSDDVIAGLLDHFIRGGQVTAGGVMQAFTSYAQVVDSPDLANDLQDKAFEALTLAAAL